MPVATRWFASAGDLGADAARLVADELAAATGAGRPFLLGCPGGRSARTTYVALAGVVARQGLDLRPLVVVMMDDYLVPGPDGRLGHEAPTAPHSCIRFAREEIMAVLNTAAPPGQRITDDRVWWPDPDHPERYDERIRAAGGIDVFLLASGAGDGHVAFNSPGADRGSRTRVVALPDTTRSDNLATFPSFSGLDAVPRHGVTVGIATIRDLSRRVLMLVHGSDKGRAAARLVAADRYDPAWPATVLAECSRPLLLLDAAAGRAAGLTPALTGRG